MANIKNKVSDKAANESRRQILKVEIQKLIDLYFKSSLGMEKDIVNIFLALTHLESRFNVNAVGVNVGIGGENSGSGDYYYSPVIQNVLKSPDFSDQQKRNVSLGLRAVGLAQSMGWNHIKGASKKNGVCELERICKRTNRLDLIDRLCVSPGDDPTTKLRGESNISNALLSGLLILEDKWTQSPKSGSGWLGSDKTVYSLKIAAAISRYLGTGRDAHGTTTNAYASSIVYGDNYAAANGASAPNTRDSYTQYALAGPTITSASGSKMTSRTCTTTA